MKWVLIVSVLKRGVKIIKDKILENSYQLGRFDIRLLSWKKREFNISLGISEDVGINYWMNYGLFMDVYTIYCLLDNES